MRAIGDQELLNELRILEGIARYDERQGSTRSGKQTRRQREIVVGLMERMLEREKARAYRKAARWVEETIGFAQGVKWRDLARRMRREADAAVYIHAGS